MLKQQLLNFGACQVTDRRRKRIAKKKLIRVRKRLEEVLRVFKGTKRCSERTERIVNGSKTSIESFWLDIYTHSQGHTCKYTTSMTECYGVISG